MLDKRSRRLQVETLETRRFLNGDPAVINIQLITTDADAGTVLSQNIEQESVEVQRGNTAPNGFPAPFVSGDFSGDDVTDLLAVDEADDWWLQLNDGTQLFELPVGPGLVGMHHLGTADFNQDGTLDVASLDETTGELWVSLNQTDGFMHEVWGSLSSDAVWSEFFVRDFNGDGMTDILGGESDGEWLLAQNDHGMRFSSETWGNFPDFDWIDVLDGEFTGDQYSDVVARAPDNTWWLWEGSDSGFPSARYFGHWKMRNDWMDVAAADFNEDGTDDVIGRSDDGSLWVGSSTPTGFNTWAWGSGWIDSANWSQVTILDINGDGKPDQLGHADSDTWWYALNTGGGFQNYFWQDAGDADFIVQNFSLPSGVNLIDSMPAGGVDIRNLEVNASLDAQDQIVITTNQPVDIWGITFTSASGSLVTLSEAERGSPEPFDLVRHNETSKVMLERHITRTVLDGSLTLDVGWNETVGEPDLGIHVDVGSPGFHVQVPVELGPPVDSPDSSIPDVNANYFTSLPPELFGPVVFVPELFVSTPFVSTPFVQPVLPLDTNTVNTISFEDAPLRVSLNDDDQLVLTAPDPLRLSGLELLSATGSMVPVGDGAVDASAVPFLSFLVNSPSRIIYTNNGTQPEQSWPLTLHGDLTLDVIWGGTSAEQDLIVEYRLEGEDAISSPAFVAEPMRLPFPLETPTTTRIFT